MTARPTTRSASWCLIAIGAVQTRLDAKSFDDSFNSQLLLTATDKVYSKTEKKVDLAKEIILNSDTLSMTLTQKPVYKNGSILKGKLKVKAQPFYQLDKDNSLFKIRPEFDIIFDTKVKEKEKD